MLGSVFGAIALLVLAELFANAHVPLPFGADAMVRSHFMGLIGIFIVLMAMGTRHGLVGFASRKAAT